MIGILGGMGPESTSYTYMRMIRYCQDTYGARLDSDFPPIIIYSMPIPDVIEGRKEVLPLLERGISTLASAGASFSLIACNTMQEFIPPLRMKFEMISLVEETVRLADKTKNWGLLATETTINCGVYQKALDSEGITAEVPSLEEQVQVTKAIREILTGQDFISPKNRLLSVIDSMADRGAGGFILACTDLPIVLSQSDTNLELLDTADIIARSAIEKWRGFK